jgi:hypothetical protein
VAPNQVRLLTFLADIRLNWKGLQATNTLAYLPEVTVMKKKKFNNIVTCSQCYKTIFFLADEETK